MNSEKLKIEFWEDEKGDYPVIDFLDSLPKKFSEQIYKKIDKVILILDFDSLIKDKDRLTILTEYKFEPQPYEVKFKSQLVRVLAYRKEDSLIFVEAINGSFSNKRLLKKAIEVYKKRVC